VRPAGRYDRAARLRHLRATLIAAALGLAACGHARADDFFAVRDQNPLLRGFYLPLPSDSPADAPVRAAAALLVSNTLNVEHRGQESLLVDGESAVLDLSLDSAIAPGWRYRLSVPLIHDGGGVLDTAIDDWHRLFGFSRGYRPYYPKGQIDYYYSGASTLVNRSANGIGDAAADVGWYPLDDAARTLSFWAGLKAPTGSRASFASDGAWDGAVWTNFALGLGRWRLAAELGVLQPFGDELFGGAAHRTAGFARLAASRAMGNRWTLRAQIDAESSRVADTQLRFIGRSLQLSLGADARLYRRWRLQMGFSEDAAVNTAPDVTFFLGIHD
jgi:hypothetical protein